MSDDLAAVLDDLSKQQQEARDARRGVDHKVTGIVGPFRLTDHHLEMMLESKHPKPDEETTWIRVCSRLEVIAQTRSETGDNWGRVVRFKDPDGKVKEVAIPMRMFSADGQEVRSLLLDQGILIEPTRPAKDGLQRYIQTALPARTVKSVDRLGWHPTAEGYAFVFPDQVIGDSEVVYQTEQTPEHAFSGAGTLEDWNENIARLAVGNSRLVMAISVAFAAPFLDIMGLEGGGFHLVGGSSTGKTTALVVAGSVWGGRIGQPEGGFIRTWRATSNGLESIAQLHNHALLALDELGQVDARELGDMPYLLANGQGKSRSSRSGGARRTAKWRLLFLSTGELSLAEKMSEVQAGPKSRAGQEVRILNIPADAGAGLGCFEDLHGHATSAAFADALKAASSRYFGTAIRPLLERILASDRRTLESELNASIDAFIKSLRLSCDVDGQVIRGAKRFALAAVAGELAADWKIVDWPAGAAVDAATRCFFDWVSYRGGQSANEETELIRQVRAFFAAHGESRFTRIEAGGVVSDSAKATINRVGFSKREHDGVHYLVLPEMMWAEVCKGFSKHVVPKILLRHGLLRPGENGRSQVNHRIPGHDHEGKTTRVFEFTPEVLASLETVDGGQNAD